LEVIIEFSSRLTPQDKRSLLSELDKTFAKRANKIESNNWMSYYAYRLSLMEEGAASSAASSSTTSTAYQSNVLNDTHKNTSRLNNRSNLMPAPLHPVNGSLNKSTARKRKQLNASSASNLSGVSVLKETILEKTKTKLNTLEEEKDAADTEDEENQEVESNDLEALKLSTINHDTTTRVGTRSSNRINNAKNLNNNNNINNNNNNNKKRSRSPLTTNNSINESIDQFNILTSTRIETNRINKRVTSKQKSSVAVSSIRTRTNGKSTEDDDDDDEEDDLDEEEEQTESDQEKSESDMLPTPKRKRKSEENNEDNHLNLSTNNKSVLSVS